MIFITGANGFIGTHLINYFAENNILYKTDIGLYDLELKKYNENIDWYNILKDVDVIVHLAGKASEKVNKNDLKKKVSNRFDVEIIKFIMEYAIKYGVKRFIHISSIKALCEFTAEGTILKPDDSPNPTSIYGATKLASEIAVKQLSFNKIEYVIIRLPLVYGKNVKANFYYLMSLVSKKIPLPLNIKKNSRSFVSIENVNNFIEICLTHKLAKNETFHLSDGKDLSTQELLDILAKNMKVRLFLFSFPNLIIKIFLRLLKKENIYNSLFESLKIDITKNYQILNWSPSRKFETNIKETVKHYLNEKNI